MISFPLKAESKSSCDVARKKLDDFFKSNSKGCKVDSECDGYYYRETCRGPVVLPKIVATPSFEKKLEEYKNQIKINIFCKKEWQMSPACSPIGAMPRCSLGQCIDASGK